jgi:hypothetical protein
MNKMIRRGALSLRTASSCPTPGGFNLFKDFRSRAKAGVNCSGQRLHIPFLGRIGRPSLLIVLRPLTGCDLQPSAESLVFRVMNE